MTIAHTLKIEEDGEILRIQDLTKSYETPQGSLLVLNKISLAIQSRTTIALMGESGSGKSTLLHLIGALDDPDTGSILIDGMEITQLKESEKAALRRNKIGFVFQQFNLIASLTVAENLAFQARLADRLDPTWLAELTHRLGLTQIASRYPEQLSGGQQQRVAVGRALAVKPRLLLADEPTGNLDEKTGDSVLALTLELVEETGCAFLMATHSARLAARLQRQCRLGTGVLTCP
ncbi:MAG: ABC transporter ATP-binding protein [Methylocystis sp.]